MVIQTKEDVESLQNGDTCFIQNPKTGELLSATYYDKNGTQNIGSSGYWIRPNQYNSRGLRKPTKQMLIDSIINKWFTITNKRD